MKTHTYRYTHTLMYSMYLLMFCGLEAVITPLTPLSGLCRLANYFNFRSSSLLFDLSAAASSPTPSLSLLLSSSLPLSLPLSRSFLPSFLLPSVWLYCTTSHLQFSLKCTCFLLVLLMSDRHDDTGCVQFTVSVWLVEVAHAHIFKFGPEAWRPGSSDGGTVSNSLSESWTLPDWPVC